jgi:hypothetical protein
MNEIHAIWGEKKFVKNAQVILISGYITMCYVDFGEFEKFRKILNFFQGFRFFYHRFGKIWYGSGKISIRWSKRASKNLREFDYEDLATRLSVIGFCGQSSLSLKRKRSRILAGNEELQQKKIKNQSAKIKMTNRN